MARPGPSLEPHLDHVSGLGQTDRQRRSGDPGENPDPHQSELSDIIIRINLSSESAHLIQLLRLRGKAK